MPSGAQLLVETLERAGVRVVFGLPGVHNLPAWEALRESEIRLVGVRHEQTAVYAADGYARATGEAGVALVTTGPGAANTLGATGEAWASRSSVLVIATDIPTTLRRPGIVGGSLHECADQAAMFGPVTKGTFRADAPGEVGGCAARALASAVAAPTRPVYLELPTDVLAGSETGTEGEQDRGGVGPFQVHSGSEKGPGAEGDVGGLLDAERPLIWAGSGAVHAGAGEAVARLAELLGAPIFTTYSSRGLVGDHPLAVGLPPHLPETGALWEQADLLIAIGSDLDGMSTQNWRMPQPPRLVAINVEPGDAGRNYAADAVLEGDAREVCEALAAAIGPEERAPWADLDTIRAGALERLRAEHPDELAFLDSFAAEVPDDAIVLADMCIPGYWLAGFHQVPAPRRLQYPMGWGTLGYAFPASLGAAAAGLGPVISVSGDGGFLFACGELATVAQERLPLTAVIVDDGGYGMLRFDQRHSGVETYGVDLATPDFVALAAAFGIEGERVEGLGAEFGAALARHVARDEPSVLVATAALEPPPTTSPRWHRTGPPAWAG